MTGHVKSQLEEKHENLENYTVWRYGIPLTKLNLILTVCAIIFNPDGVCAIIFNPDGVCHQI